MLTNITRLARCSNVYLRPIKQLRAVNYANPALFRHFSTTGSPAADITGAEVPPVSNYGTLDQLHLKTEEFISAEHTYVDEVDISGVTATMQPINEANTSNFFDILTSFSPDAMYEVMDKASRDILMYFSHDLGLGLGWGIITCSFLLRFVFVPITTKTQLNAVKMKLLEPEMKNFQSMQQKLQRTGDFNAMKQARQNFTALRQRYGISSITPFLNLTQIPFMITWFLSLRYVANTPDKFPSIKTDGFLWFQDLSASDPYFILPLISAFISYYNIQLTAYNATSAGGTSFARYSRYMKYAPFVAMPFAVFFPAGLNLYWIVSALCQLGVSLVTRSENFRRMVGIPQYLPGSILEKLHGVKKPDIIKVVVVESEKASASAPQTQVGGQAQAVVNAATKATPVAEQSAGGQRPVQIFTNRPKGKKN